MDFAATGPQVHTQRTRIDYYYLSKHCILYGELVNPYLQSMFAKGSFCCNSCDWNNFKIGERDATPCCYMSTLWRWWLGCGKWSQVHFTSMLYVLWEVKSSERTLQSLSSIAVGEGFYPRCMVEWFWALVIPTHASTVGIERKDFPCSIFSTLHLSPLFEWGYCCTCTDLLLYLVLCCKLYFVFFLGD